MLALSVDTIYRRKVPLRRCGFLTVFFTSELTGCHATGGKEAATCRLGDGGVSFSAALSHPGQSQDAADVLGDNQRGFGSRHGHVEEVQLIRWDFT